MRVCSSRVLDGLVVDVKSQRRSRIRKCDHHGRRVALGLLPGEEVSVKYWMVGLAKPQSVEFTIIE